MQEPGIRRAAHHAVRPWQQGCGSPYGPHVDLLAVVLAAHQQLWPAVPAGGHIVRDGHVAAWRELPGKAKVAQLELARSARACSCRFKAVAAACQACCSDACGCMRCRCGSLPCVRAWCSDGAVGWLGTGSAGPSAMLTSGGYEEVLWLDVPMHDVVLVAPVDCLDQLVDVLPNLWSWCQCVSDPGHTLRFRDGIIRVRGHRYRKADPAVARLHHSCQIAPQLGLHAARRPTCSDSSPPGLSSSTSSSVLSTYSNTRYCMIERDQNSHDLVLQVQGAGIHGVTARDRPSLPACPCAGRPQ